MGASAYRSEDWGEIMNPLSWPEGSVGLPKFLLCMDKIKFEAEFKCTSNRAVRFRFPWCFTTPFQGPFKFEIRGFIGRETWHRLRTKPRFNDSKHKVANAFYCGRRLTMKQTYSERVLLHPNGVGCLPDYPILGRIPFL